MLPALEIGLPGGHARNDSTIGESMTFVNFSGASGAVNAIDRP